MKKLIIPFICILSILTVLININPLTDKIITFLNPPRSNSTTTVNLYSKNTNFSFVKNTTNFTPYGKQDILNIFYTIINSGTTDFTFYCPKEYQNCIEDVNTFSNDDNLLTHLNNFVHPFNSFTKIKTTISDNGEITMQISYLYTPEQITKINNEVNNLTKKIITKDLKTDYDKLKAIHDYIINNTKYDINNDKKSLSYSAYGALFNNLATCNGYTDLMAIFLSNLNFENYKVATTEEESGSTSGHVWNAVKINNEWLHIDLTWDDPVSSDNKDYLYHKYFLINTEELETADSNITSKEHNFNSSIYVELKK